MASIYIHIPYCKQRCVYCDFHFSIIQKDKLEMLKCIKIEIANRKDYLNNELIDTLYFGGGTPSILEKSEIKGILKHLHNTFKISTNAEITIECNPDDLTLDKLKALKQIGINRLSIGVQSFKDKDLEFMKRSHNANEAIKSIKLAQNIGFNNITIDLIYGLPNQSIADWEQNIEQAFDLDIQHLSAYALTVENKTILSHMVKKNKVKILSDNNVIKQFNILQNKAEKKGFIHYEISNFGKKGFFSKHNSGYWKSIHYLGIGPSAHSYNGHIRRSNISSNKKYIRNIILGLDYFEDEFLSESEQYNEYIYTSLRTIWGIDINTIAKKYSYEVFSHFQNEISKWENKKFIISDKKKYTLTRSGKSFADMIASDLFIV
ncbi:MAG: radical SAM family heme chaperone HemW [Flavobacteriales bacterium]|nr:radical SAM family heme chaperone HemW [Flavobacteriales bacterium]MDG1933762.1 radical SAM family heme chaperone HemW [Flavobacteriales bacterium]MDG2086363.1 radical SAM family heme chaperone HemW [Flavobacteriales bacterium]